MGLQPYKRNPRELPHPFHYAHVTQRTQPAMNQQEGSLEYDLIMLAH